MSNDSAIDTHDLEDHKETYAGFVAVTVSVSMACFFILVCLIINGFSDAGAAINLPVSLIGMFLGFIFLAVEVKAGSKFYASGALFVLYGIIAVFMIT